MPIYEYRCSKCGHQLEAIQKISDAPLVQCPSCQADGLQKLISAASFRLKGGGWYETDFKKDNKKHLADSGDSAESGKTEAKPDSKTADASTSSGSDAKAKPAGSGKDTGTQPAAKAKAKSDTTRKD